MKHVSLKNFYEKEKMMGKGYRVMKKFFFV